MKKLFNHFICRFIPNRTTRNRVRFLLDNKQYVNKCIKYIKSLGDFHNIKKIVGHGSRNLVVSVDNKYVFKFPGHGNGYEKALREKRITDAMRKISPFNIPDMEILDFDGVAVRKYSYVGGINLEYFHPKKIPHDIESKIAKQLAKFLYVIGQSDLPEIRDLKPNKNAKPSILYGWCQNDIKYNFMMDEKTFDIIAIIDWEEAGFNDFCHLFTFEKNYRSLISAVLREYLDLYAENQNRKLPTSKKRTAKK